MSSLLKDPLSHPLSSFDDGDRSHENSGDLDCAFEFGLDFGELRASTPKMDQQIGSHVLNSSHGTSIGGPLDTNVVLRIDNVPWVSFLWFRLSIAVIHLSRISPLYKSADGFSSRWKGCMFFSIPKARPSAMRMSRLGMPPLQVLSCVEKLCPPPARKSEAVFLVEGGGPGV